MKRVAQFAGVLAIAAGLTLVGAPAAFADGIHIGSLGISLNLCDPPLILIHWP